MEVEAATTLCSVEGASGEHRHSLQVPSPDATTSNSIVHNVHPTHPFLDMKAQPASETPNHPEISEGITDADSDDDADEIESRQRVQLICPRHDSCSLSVF